MAIAAYIRGPSGYDDIQDSEKNRAFRALGSSNLLWFYCPIGAGLSATLTENGTGSGTTVDGAFELSSSAGAGNYYRVIGYSNGSVFSKPLRTNASWFVSGYCKVNLGAVAAGTEAFVGAGDASGANLRMGVYGASSTTHFSLTGHTGTAIVSGVAFDTSYHTFRAWRMGGLTTLEIDGVVQGTGDVDISSSIGPLLQVSNGGAAVNQKITAVWFAAAAPRI